MRSFVPGYIKRFLVGCKPSRMRGGKGERAKGGKTSFLPFALSSSLPFDQDRAYTQLKNALILICVLLTLAPLWAYAQDHGVKAAPTPADICVYQGENIDAHFFVEPLADPEASGKTASATFDVTFVDESASDPWPEAAKAAFEYAAAIWAGLITSAVPINVEATWADLGSCSGNQFSLGAAGPNFVRSNFAGAPRANTWYPDALADALNGSDLGEGDFDIIAEFNRRCGPNSADRWYLGTDANTPAGRIDLVSVAVHELGHGLGFFGSADVDDGNAGNGTECNGAAGTGCLGLGNAADPVIYDRFTEDGNGTSLLSLSSPSTSLAVALVGDQGGGIFFDGPSAAQANGGAPPALYAVDPFEAGASYSHLDEDAFDGTPHALMTPFLAQAEAIHDPGEIVCGLFRDMGWTVTASCGSLATTIQDEEPVPATVELSAVFPNPFNPQTQFTLSLAEEQHVTIAVFDLLGRRVTQLHEGRLTAGSVHRFTFEAGDLPSGLYLIRVVGETFNAVRSATLLK